MATKHLIVILGPTAAGKTRISVELASERNAPILSADSRQFYREMNIGTAKPSQEEMAGVPHYFIDSLSIDQDYNAAKFEEEALEVLNKIYKEKDLAFMVGGSGLYIDAVCQGIDQDVPPSDPEIREELNRKFKDQGLEPLLRELQEKDPVHYDRIDRNNPQRVIRALEACMVSGRPFSSFHKGEASSRPFRITKIGIWLPREELHEQIDKRVDRMMEKGLLEEARELHPHRGFNSLETVGYQELFDHLEGKLSMEEAIRLIKRNTRRYAKRQMTWFRRDKDTLWFQPDEKERIDQAIRSRIGNT